MKLYPNPPELTGRISKCSCGSTAPSSPLLPFFEFQRPGITRGDNHLRVRLRARGAYGRRNGAKRPVEPQDGR